MRIEIKNRFNGQIIICGEYESVKDCLEKNRSADLSSADLSSADLSSADLSFADLRYNDLSSANLSFADLSSANLSFADLRSADLRSANLSFADLRSADLRSANLSFANLSFADLSSANFKYLLRYQSVQSILTSINWGNLSNDLTLEMMRHDAESCGIKVMTKWANGGDCPFNAKVRDYQFREDKSIWIEGKPKLRGIKLLKALCKDKGYKFK